MNDNPYDQFDNPYDQFDSEAPRTPQGKLPGNVSGNGGRWQDAPLAQDPWAGFKEAPAAPFADPRAGKPVDYGMALQYGIANAIPFAHDIGAAIQAGETYLPKSIRPDDTGPEIRSGASF
jgi:hypothetical protein